MEPLQAKTLVYISNARMPTEKAHGLQVVKMCVVFARNFKKVKLILPWRFNHIHKDLFQYYNIDRTFEVQKLPSIDLTFLNLPYIGFWIQSLSFVFFAFVYLLFCEKSDYVLYLRDWILLPFLAVAGREFIFEAHNVPKHFLWYKNSLKKARTITVVTHCLKEELIRKGIDRECILVARDGVDLNDFEIDISRKQCREKINLSLDENIVIYTGHLYDWKGAHILAEAAKILDGDCLFVFVGGTDSDLKKFRQCYKQNVMFVGHRPHAEIRYWLKAADVLVLPNSAKQKISRCYTSPVKMFEYMASKRPIVASAIPSLKEVLNEENSFLVEADNPEKLAMGIKKVLDNKDLALEKANCAFADVKRFIWDERAKKILEFSFYENNKATQ